MKKWNKLLWLLLLIWSCNSPLENKGNPSEKTKLLLIAQYQDFKSEVNLLDELIRKESNQESIQEQFRKARLGYKKMESLLSFYYPEYSKKLNGAAIDKNDYHDSNRKEVPATGFQVVEELLFTDEVEWEELIIQSGILHGFTQGLEKEVESIEFSDSNIWEAQRLQLLRILSLGITGFDSPISFHSIPEAKAGIEGIRDYLAFYPLEKNDLVFFENAINYLDQNSSSFNEFDRAEFIKDFAIPISKRIFTMQKRLAIPFAGFLTAMNSESEVFFLPANFNLDFFAPSYNRSTTQHQIDLGKTLFFDPILSGNGEVSCASCHQPQNAYADHHQLAIDGEGSKARNTPTLLNSAFQNSQFLDGRVTYLEDQAQVVIGNQDEMHGSFKDAVLRIAEDQKYSNQFESVFGAENSVTDLNLLKSIGSYVRSLSAPESKFDSYLVGKTELESEELRGFNLFMGKGKCATCHFFPLFNGSVPPLFMETESEVLGVPKSPLWENAIIDEDLGEFEINQAELKRFAFKTPTVRNAEITFPYMHNGVYNSLEEVIKFYNLGGGAGIGIELDNQTLPPDSLQLNKKEIEDLISFIKTLTDLK
jgi:cytochrome c peroxidase